MGWERRQPALKLVVALAMLVVKRLWEMDVPARES